METKADKAYAAEAGTVLASGGKLPEAFIFDLDGTLVDSMPDLETSMNEMLGIMGLPPRTRTQLLSQINAGAYEFVSRSLAPELQKDKQYVLKCLEVYQGCYAKHCCERTRPYPGMAEAINRLHARGAKLAVNSNKDQEHVQRIADTLFPGCFDIALGAGRFPTKPDPAGTEWLVSQLASGADISDVAFVGDSDVDMHTSEAAGCLTVGVSWGYRSPDLLRSLGARYVVTNAEAFQ